MSPAAQKVLNWRTTSTGVAHVWAATGRSETCVFLVSEFIAEYRRPL
jgi:hypothetical protein